MRQRVRRVGQFFGWLFLLAIVLVLGFVAYVTEGVVAGGHDATGVLAGSGVRAPVRIDRDARGIPHIRAANERDAFFANGYVEGSDRMFQMDIFRRAVSGRLAEVFGKPALAHDQFARSYDPAGLVADQERQLDPELRIDLEAFADGVNFAMRTRPLAPEFRALAYRPEPWTARDSLLTATATVLDLVDRWSDVATRDAIGQRFGPTMRAAFYPMTDPAYDAPIVGKPAPVAPLPALSANLFDAPVAAVTLPERPDRSGLGSNNFAAGAALTATHRALLANDPHLGLRMPGIWYLIDIETPDMHVAGASLAGTPGVVLGHNAHVAWGMTNGTIASTVIYREKFRTVGAREEYLAGTRWLPVERRTETFTVRFAKSVSAEYLATRHGFVSNEGGERFAVAWVATRDRRSSLPTFLGLSRAHDVASALRVLAQYPGPTQNAVLADDSGVAAYAMAGDVWSDPSWALAAIDGPTSASTAPIVPFARMPRVTPSRTALVFSANNRTYGAGYPLQLTSNFAPPYRAARIAELLRGNRRLDVAAFSRVQADLTSLSERELARATAAAIERSAPAGDKALRAFAAALRRFDGRYASQSHDAVLVSMLRYTASDRLVRIHLGPDLSPRYLDGNGGEALVALLRALRERPSGWVLDDHYDDFLIAAARVSLARMDLLGRTGKSWGDVGAVTARNPLDGFGFTWWNGTRFPGLGDPYTPHVQGASVTQSFRAVWDVGNWNAGGIVIPQGESGEPGSPHYRDGAPVWLTPQKLIPLPFGDAAVAAARTETLELRP